MMLKKCKEAVQVLRSNVLLFCSIVFTVWLPTGILIGLIDPANASALLQAQALSSLLTPISTGALLFAACRSSTGEKPTYKEAMVAGIRSWGKIFASRFVANVIIAVGTLAFFVPGILLAVRYSLLEASVVLEGTGVNTSRRRSMRLSKGMTWRLFGATLVFAFGTFVLFLPIYLLTLLIEPFSAAEEVVISLILAGIWACLTILFFTFYLEARAEEGPEPLLERPPASTFRRLAYVTVVLLVVLLSFLPAFRFTVAEWNDVPTSAMKPSVLNGDRILVHRAAYDLRLPFTRRRLVKRSDPVRGDVVVFRSPEDRKLLVQRIVGLPNETVEIRGSRLFINGDPATYERTDSEVVRWIAEEDQPSYFFASESAGGRRYPIMITIAHPSVSYGPSRIPESCYFVLGDNRSNSRDSRWFGPVGRDAILGEATAVVLSFDPDRFYLPRWKRFFTPLP